MTNEEPKSGESATPEEYERAAIDAVECELGPETAARIALALAALGVLEDDEWQRCQDLLVCIYDCDSPINAYRAEVLRLAREKVGVYPCLPY